MGKDPFHQHGGQEAEMLEVKSEREGYSQWCIGPQ